MQLGWHRHTHTHLHGGDHPTIRLPQYLINAHRIEQSHCGHSVYLSISHWRCAFIAFAFCDLLALVCVRFYKFYASHIQARSCASGPRIYRRRIHEIKNNLFVIFWASSFWIGQSSDSIEFKSYATYLFS